MVNQDLIEHRERVSALADGQLRGVDFARTVEMMGAGTELRADWHRYHVIGDVLRSTELAQCSDDAGFLARFSARLGQESSSVRPVPDPTIFSISPSSVPPRLVSANQSSFRWKVLAGVASIAAVGAIGWSVVASDGWMDKLSSQPQLAGTTKPESVTTTPVAATAMPSVSSAAVSGSESAVMIRDPHLDALLAAHKQFGGTSALQKPAGFLRNATFEGSGR